MSNINATYLCYDKYAEVFSITQLKGSPRKDTEIYGFDSGLEFIDLFVFQSEELHRDPVEEDKDLIVSLFEVC